LREGNSPNSPEGKKRIASECYPHSITLGESLVTVLFTLPSYTLGGQTFLLDELHHSETEWKHHHLAVGYWDYPSRY